MPLRLCARTSRQELKIPSRLGRAPYKTSSIVTAPYFFAMKKYEPGWVRTIDTRLKRAVLYQLSYGPPLYFKSRGFRLLYVLTSRRFDERIHPSPSEYLFEPCATDPQE